VPFYKNLLRKQQKKRKGKQQQKKDSWEALDEDENEETKEPEQEDSWENFDVEEEKKRYNLEMEAARNVSGVRQVPTTEFSIISFALVCLIGYLIGSIKIFAGPLGYISLESTGGVLIGSLVLGYIGKIGPISFRMDPKVLSILRELGLAFFLAIVGLNYGYGAIDAICSAGIILAIASLFVGVIAVMAGFLLGRYVFKLNWIMLSGAICGGMTSTPG